MTMRMPAEWAAHELLWIGFPGDPAEWPVALAEAQRQSAAFADAVAADGRGEAVQLVCRTESDAAIARALVGPHVRVVVQPFGDIWLRDTGPICVTDGGARALVDFDFNGWGGKFDMPGDADIGARLAATAGLPLQRADWIFEGGAIDTDGTGLFVTTQQCLLNPNRNPGFTAAEVERRLAEALGLSAMLWLGDGLAHDHTDGHVDNLARFVAPGVLAVPEATTADDPNRAVYDDAAARARAFGVEVVRIPSPGLYHIDGEVAPASYMNFVVANAVVAVPQYGVPNDRAALNALRPFFPDHTLVGLPSDAILRGGGSFHCCSQQLPSVPGPAAR